MEFLRSLLYYLWWFLYIFFYYMIIIIILTWIPGIYDKPWYQKIRKTIDWYMGRFSGWLVIGPLDLTPIIGFLIYQLALEGLRRIIIYM